jgi:Right handed beta helix region
MNGVGGGMYYGLSRLCRSVLNILFFIHLIDASVVLGATDRGAYKMPYTRYDSSMAQSGGEAKLVKAVNFDQTSTASEATGQAYVALPKNGSYVEWKMTTAGKGVDIRFTMPDSSDGTGTAGSLDILVNGQLDQTVPMSSYHAWQYFNTNNSDPSNLPLGDASKKFMRFDEVSFVLKHSVNAGDTIRIQKTNGDAIEYGIDFIEVEQIPAIKPMPKGFVSIIDFGAKPNDDISDLKAMNDALVAAAKAGTGVYIPEGRFVLDDKLTLKQSNIKIQGAGIWYTELYFSNPKVFKGGIYARVSNVEISDFYMDTINNQRESSPGTYMIYKAFMGTYGDKSYIHDVWAEHFECGAWIGGYDEPYPIDITTNLVISNVRFRNNYADGVNFAQGTSNSIVEHSNIRNTGDDGLAMWPSNSNNAPTEKGNIFRFNTVEHGWRAGGVAIFGGSNHEVSNLLIKDCIAGSAIRFTNEFPGYPYEGGIKFTNIDIQNCGTSNDLWNQPRGAIEFFGSSNINSLTFDNISILNSQRHAVQLYGTLQNINFDHVTIDGTGLDGHVRDQQSNSYGGLGIWAQGNSGGATFNNTLIKNTKDQAYINLNQSFNLLVNTGGGDDNSSLLSGVGDVVNKIVDAGKAALDTIIPASPVMATSNPDSAASSGGLPSSASSSGSSSGSGSGSGSGSASSPASASGSAAIDNPVSSVQTSMKVASGQDSSYFLIKNKWQGQYLYDSGGQLKYSVEKPDSNDQSYQWLLESRGGTYSIKNMKTGGLINIETFQDEVTHSDSKCPPVVGDSCKWKIEKASNNFVRLHSGWHDSDYLHVQDQKGYVQHGSIYPVWDSAQWIFIYAHDVSNQLASGNKLYGYFQIKNKWNNAFLYDAGDRLGYSQSQPGNDALYQWNFESRGNGLYDIRNRATGDYINIEKLQDFVQSDASNKPAAWESSQWFIEDASNGYIRFKNKWHQNDYMHIQDLKEYVQHGSMYPIWDSAQWLLTKTECLSVNSDMLQLGNCKADVTVPVSTTPIPPLVDNPNPGGSASSSGSMPSSPTEIVPPLPSATSSSGGNDSILAGGQPAATTPGSITGSPDASVPAVPSVPIVPSVAEPSNPSSSTVTGSSTSASSPVDAAPSSSTASSSPQVSPTGQGATMPWTEYQAEEGETNAQILGPSRQKWDANHIEAEAIGRMAVRLNNPGDYVSFKTVKEGNGIIVRYSIPDSSTGGGINATLGLYVNGVRVKSLPLTSRFSWNYQGEKLGSNSIDIPAAQPHTFFDEVHVLVDNIPAGATVKLQKDSQDTAGFYVIDLVDIEAVPAPLTMPAGFTSVVDLGIKPDDGVDHADDIIEAMTKTSKLWFPAGTYIAQKFVRHAQNAGIDNPGTEVRGAGMWYTNLIGKKTLFFCNGAVQCIYKDLYIGGDSTTRNEEQPEKEGGGPQKAFAGPLGVNSLLENLWIEHKVAAIWVGNDPPYQTQPTDKLTIRNCRIHNTFADGINLDNGTTNSVIENCHIRNTGDDGVAFWSVKWTDWVKNKTAQLGPDFISKPESRDAPDQGQEHGNVVRNTTVQMPVRANCFAAYGGTGNLFENNLCEDVLTYPGLFIDREFSAYPFKDINGGNSVTTFRNITVIRGGGSMFGESTGNPEQHGALTFSMCEGDVSDILVENINLIDPTFSGIEFRGFGVGCPSSGTNLSSNVVSGGNSAQFSNVTLRNITVTNPGTYGIEVQFGGGKGQVNFEGVTVTGAGKGALQSGDAPSSFFQKGKGNSGW